MPVDQDATFIRIAILENVIEAQLLSSVLTEYGIPHRLRSYHDTAYDGLFQLQKGWGAIYSAPEERQTILEALAELRAQPIDLPNDEPDC